MHTEQHGTIGQINQRNAGHAASYSYGEDPEWLYVLALDLFLPACLLMNLGQTWCMNNNALHVTHMEWGPGHKTAIIAFDSVI